MSQYAAFVAVVAADSESPVAQLIGLRSLQVGKPNVWTMVVAAMEASIICLVGAIMMQMEKVLRGGNGVSGPQKPASPTTAFVLGYFAVGTRLLKSTSDAAARLVKGCFRVIHGVCRGLLQAPLLYLKRRLL